MLNLKKAQFVYIFIINDCFILLRTYLYIIRHALKPKHIIRVWTFYVPTTTYPCISVECGAKAPSAPSNDATDLVYESQVKPRFELVMELVQTINQQTLILIQMFTFLGQKMSKNDDIKNFFLPYSRVLFENVTSSISSFCVFKGKNKIHIVIHKTKIAKTILDTAYRRSKPKLGWSLLGCFKNQDKILWVGKYLKKP